MLPLLTRRHFLLSTAALTAGGYSGALPPSERLRVGAVGIAGQGDHDLRQIAAAGAEVVALCDVDENRKEVGKHRETFGKAKFFADYRKMIDAGGLDAVVVATPDHTHAAATLAALNADLHAFCEKPLAHTVEEARLVATTAARRKRVTQMGTQIHAGDNYRRVVELVRSGAVGPVREVHVWVAKDWGGGRRPKNTPPVPKGLHWDLWLGPAAERPYHPVYLPANWRRFWDFGGGTLNDMACHYADLPFWALKLRHPTRVEAEGPPADPVGTAHSLVVHYDFPARGDMPACKLHWYDGGKKPDVPGFKLPEKWGDGVLFVGDKGMLLANYDRRVLLPEAAFKGFKALRPAIKNSVRRLQGVGGGVQAEQADDVQLRLLEALTEAVFFQAVAALAAGQAVRLGRRR
ncbi:MAG: Gfo/Idh/MocA family oxidoreductase [Gemmataceae bacterium]